MSRAWYFMVLTIGYCNVLYDTYVLIRDVERTTSDGLHRSSHIAIEYTVVV